MTNHEHSLPTAASPPTYDAWPHDGEGAPAEHGGCRLAELAPLLDAVDGVLD